MIRALPLLVGLAIAYVSAAMADPLTCRLFRERLDGGLLATSGAGIPEAPVYRETGTAADGGKRLSWLTPSLSGTLSCGPDDHFQEVYVSLVATQKERFVEQLKRFVAMNGGAICATNEGTTPACIDAGKSLLQAGLQQMGAAFQKKATAPSGLASRLLQPHLKAELTAAPTLVTFTLGVVDAAMFDAARAPLPSNAAAPAPQP